jgi:hypothetical protein
VQLQQQQTMWQPAGKSLLKGQLGKMLIGSQALSVCTWQTVAVAAAAWTCQHSMFISHSVGHCDWQDARQAASFSGCSLRQACSLTSYLLDMLEGRVTHMLSPVVSCSRCTGFYSVLITVTVTKLGPQAHPQRSQTRLMGSNKQEKLNLKLQ